MTNMNQTSTQSYDWILVGGGLTGSALGYELARQGFTVLLLDQSSMPQNATRLSYGGISYWSVFTEVTQQLAQEAMAIYPQLSDELESDIQFRELDLLMPIDPEDDPQAIAASYERCAIPPQLISPDAACDLEPLLRREAIAAALHARHGHVDPESIVQAYRQAMLRLGGTVSYGTVTGIVKQGVTTATGDTYHAERVVICAGGLSRTLCRQLGVTVANYYTHAELIETPPVDIQFHTMLMAAKLKRFEMEAEASIAATDFLWDEPGHELTLPILDEGVIQFKDGRLRIGQISRALTDPQLRTRNPQSETQMRQKMGRLIPVLNDVSGVWHSCLVSFSRDGLPLVGALPDIEGLHIFSGFSSPFALLPPVARRYAAYLTGKPDEIIPQLAPDRF